MPTKRGIKTEIKNDRLKQKLKAPYQEKDLEIVIKPETPFFTDHSFKVAIAQFRAPNKIILFSPLHPPPPYHLAPDEYEDQLADTLSHEILHWVIYKIKGSKACMALDNLNSKQWPELHRSVSFSLKIIRAIERS